MIIRKATHAGSWYSGNKDALLDELRKYFRDDKLGPGAEPGTTNNELRTIIGGISPHAGYYYSGRCAAFTYLNLFKERIPDTIIILGNTHIPYNRIGLFEKGQWETPLGNIDVDDELAGDIMNRSEVIIPDSSAFMGRYKEEHNIEIQLPLIKYCALDKEIKIVPLKVGSRNYDLLGKAALDIASAIKSSKKDIVVVASSDMFHEDVFDEDRLDYLIERNKEIIDAFVSLDSKKVFELASNFSVCGSQTITLLMEICTLLDAKRGKELKYYTSHDITGRFGYVVAYFSGIIIK